MLKLRKKHIKKILKNNEGFVLKEKNIEYEISRGSIKTKTNASNDEFEAYTLEFLTYRKIKKFFKKHLENIRFVA